MNRRTFITQAAMALGAVSGPVTISLRNEQDSKTETIYDPADWAQVRDQFPLSPDWIHFTSFFIASHPRPVVEAIERHRYMLDKEPVSYVTEKMITENIEMVQRKAVAEYLDANPDHIALTDSTTMGLALIYSTLKLRPDQEIITTTQDHYATEESLNHRAERTGASFRKISLYDDDHPETATKDEIITRMKNAITGRTRALAVTWVHSSTGVKLPIAEMAKELKEINADRDPEDRVLLCVDGVHGFGIENVTVDELGCDFLITGTHKWLYGPRGTGIIWGKSEAWDAVFPVIPSFSWNAYSAWLSLSSTDDITLGDRFTPGGFHSFENRWAVAEAFQFQKEIGKERVENRIHSLNTRAKEALAEMPHVELRTPISPELSSGMTCFEVDGVEPGQIVAKLLENRIIASTTPYRVVYGRIAPGIVNNEEEVDKCIRVIAEMG
jgi:selenocysteine lyase/cysteine desulfurase